MQNNPGQSKFDLKDISDNLTVQRLQLKKGQPLGSKSVLGEREDDARLLLVFYIKDRKPQTKVQ